jgi:hypothetical protein
MSWRYTQAVVFAAVCLGSPSAPAQIYKCEAENGKITYAANPCYGEHWQRFEKSSHAESRRRKAAPAPDSAGNRSVKETSSSEPPLPDPQRPIDGSKRLESIRELNPSTRQR